eukprot:2363943-Alexandrium_andersonii.AAC.1
MPQHLPTTQTAQKRPYPAAHLPLAPVDWHLCSSSSGDGVLLRRQSPAIVEARRPYPGVPYGQGREGCSGSARRLHTSLTLVWRARATCAHYVNKTGVEKHSRAQAAK